MTCANDMDPYISDAHLSFPTLTKIEEMFLSPIHLIMKCYWLQNGGIGYKCQVLAIKQHVAKTLSSVPLQVSQLPIYIV